MIIIKFDILQLKSGKMDNNYELTDIQWERIKNQIHHSKRGRPPKNDRLIIDAMLLKIREDVKWHKLPSQYGSWKTVYSRFCKWYKDGTLQNILITLNENIEI